MFDKSGFCNLDFYGSTPSKEFDIKTDGLFSFDCYSYRKYTGSGTLSITMHINNILNQYLYGNGIYIANNSAPIEFFIIGFRSN